MSQTQEPQTGFLDVNGARLYYEVAGAGHPLVLVHAGICDSRMWDEQWEVFSQHFLVIRYDMRGFGKSEMPSGPFAHHDDLYQLLGLLGVRQAHCVAVSMGGRVAIEVALEHPEMVDGLVLVASGVGGVEPSAALEQAWAAADAAYAAGDLDRANELELQIWVDGPKRIPGEVDPRVRERVREMNRNNFALLNDEATENALEPPARSRLGELSVPTLIVVGDGDQPHVLISASQFEASIHDSRKVIMQGVAHLPSMERPEEFNRLVLDFLRGLGVMHG